MHELSVAIALVELASEALAPLAPGRVDAVRLRLGILSGVATDSLAFSFDLATSGTPIEGARLIIDDVPAEACCRTCAAEWQLQTLAARRCPACGGSSVQLTGGRDIELVALEILDT